MGGFRWLRLLLANARLLSNGHVGGAQRSERGAASVEFASTLPLLILILLGTIDFGRFAYAAIAVTNAARTGAAFCNYRSVDGCDSGIVEAVTVAVQNAAPALLLTQIVVTPPTGAGADCPAQCLSVLIVYPFSTLLPIPRPEASGAWVWEPVTLTVVRSANMRVG